MSNVLLLSETLMVNIIAKNNNKVKSCEGEICKQQQIKQSVLA